MSTFFNVKNRSIRLQLALIIGVLVALSFALTAFLVYQKSYDTLLSKSLLEHQSKIEALSDTLEQSFQGYLAQVSVLERSFSNQYLAGLEMGSYEVKIGGKLLPQLLVDGNEVSSNSFVDKFGQDTGAVATVFVKQGADYIRLSTSLTNNSGQRVVGSALDRRSPAYQALQQRQHYYAKVSLFGRDYLTYYAPLLSADDKVIGASFVGLDVSEVSKLLFASMANIGWGDSGYSIVFDNGDANRGRYLHHPRSSEIGQSVLSQATPAKPFGQLFAQEAGVLRYAEQENGIARDKYLAFAKVSGWDWVLAGGTYVSEITKESAELLNTIIWLAALASALTLAVVMLALGRIIKPLDHAKEYMAALGEGNVSVQIPAVDANSGNELTNLTHDMRAMALRLSELVGQIKSTSVRSNNGAGQVAEQAHNSLNQSDSQQQQIDQMAAAIEEMAQSANAVAEQVESVASTVRTANLDSESGSALVQEMELQIGSFDAQLNASTDAIHKVNDESKNIQAVTNMIDSIAEQTNLLALNAAIEAARAGEQGRGFAVVADEVRQLAHRTQNSVQEVVGIINQLESRIDSAVELMNESQQTSQVVKSKAAAAGESLRSITSQINGIASMAENIAATSEQQAQVSQEIASSAGRVSDLNRMTRDSSAATADSAVELQRLASELNEQVDFFH
ncbi:Cache 3/Cache 2 fusion domain-containing protein [uncultured Ferrimonas sp.]|uniref:methyl-accepting chemotaxis protein n=1 Tax=uncultured Ferrimonas sp. TaxID=432640 RepID=UPI0026363E11|nr:Cache 3/Cache 2 fusion domain-containing protein [uncultured Ferrimonas sp.]